MARTVHMQYTVVVSFTKYPPWYIRTFIIDKEELFMFQDTDTYTYCLNDSI